MTDEHKLGCACAVCRMETAIIDDLGLSAAGLDQLVQAIERAEHPAETSADDLNAYVEQARRYASTAKLLRAISTRLANDAWLAGRRR